MNDKCLLSPVKGRGKPPASFLSTLIAWAKQADDAIFAPNSTPHDVMNVLVGVLGPWDGVADSPERLLHRKAAMCELLRCLAGFESSWDWIEGVDTTNKRSQAKLECQETGIFQCSYDSLALDKSGTLKAFLVANGVHNAQEFIHAMKGNHSLALDYAARLLRIDYRWDGPIKRGEINSSLSRAAVNEFRALI